MQFSLSIVAPATTDLKSLEKELSATGGVKSVSVETTGGLSTPQEGPSGQVSLLVRCDTTHALHQDVKRNIDSIFVKYGVPTQAIPPEPRKRRNRASHSQQLSKSPRRESASNAAPAYDHSTMCSQVHALGHRSAAQRPSVGSKTAATVSPRPFRARNRGEVKYHSQRYASLTQDTPLAQADRLASRLLAIVWSSGGSAVIGDPHNERYKAYTSNTITGMTVPVKVMSLTKAERKDYSSRRTQSVAITNPHPRSCAAHQVKAQQLRQLDIQLECVAAAYIGDTWYVASNTTILLDSDVELTLQGLGSPPPKYQIIRDFTPNRHAEMQILRHLRLHKIPLRGIEVGVSKPCCPRCKEVLDREQVAYSSYHNSGVDESRWEAPF